MSLPTQLDAASPRAPVTPQAVSGAEPVAEVLPEYRRPEDYPADQRAQYVAQAKQYLDAAVASPAAARVALDLYMVAVVRQDQALSDYALAKLVFDHPGSLPATFAVATFSHEPKPYREFLQRQFLAMARTLRDQFDQPPIPPQFASAFCQAVELGQRHCNANMLSDGLFLLEVAVAADMAGQSQLRKLCLEKLNAGNSSEKTAGAIAFDEQHTLSERYLGLCQLNDQPHVRLLKLHLWGRLSASQRQSPELRRRRIEDLLTQHQFKALLPLLAEELRHESNEQTQYWYGWALACTGQDTAALLALEQLAADDSTSPLAGSARELAEAIRGFELAQAQHAAMLHQFFQQLRKGQVDRIEIVVSTTRKSPSFNVYLAIDMALAESIELIIRLDGQQKFRYRNEDGVTRLFVPGDATVHEINSAVYFAPKLNIDVAESGVIDFGFAGGLAAEPGGLARCLQDVLNSPVIDSEAAVSELLRRLNRRGAFPLAPRQQYGHEVYEWLTLTRKGPVVVAIHVTEDGRVVSLRGPTHDCQLRYGQGESFTFAPPPWPNAPVKTHEQLDGRWLLQLMTALAAAAGK